MNNVKSFFQSKTIWGAVIAVAPPVANLLGYTITGADVAQVTSSIDAIVTGAGALLAVFGRVTATKVIGR
jgi:hypothetical protein